MQFTPWDNPMGTDGFEFIEYAAPADWPVDAVLPQRRHGSGTTAARPMQCYLSPMAAIADGSYRMRPLQNGKTRQPSPRIMGL